MSNNDLVKELASLNNRFISADQVNFQHYRSFQGLDHEIAPNVDLTLYINGNTSFGGAAISVRDRHNSFKVIQPTDVALGFYNPFRAIMKDGHLTVIKVIYVDNQSLVKPFPPVDYIEDRGIRNIEKTMEMEQNSPDFGLYQTHEQTARLKALRDLIDAQDRTGVRQDYVVLYVHVPLTELTPGVPYYVECLDLLVRVEGYTEDRDTKVIDADIHQHYIHPYSNKGSNYIVERTIEKLRQNISSLNVQVKSGKRVNAENTAYHVQFDRIIEIPITDAHHTGDDGVYLTYQDPKSGTIENEVIPLEHAHMVGVFFNLSEANGKKQQLDSKYRAELFQQQEKEKAEISKREENDRRQEEESAKRTLEKVKLAATIIGGVATVAGALYGLFKLLCGVTKLIPNPFNFLARLAW